MTQVSEAVNAAEMMAQAMANAEPPDLNENALTVLRRRYLSKDREGNIMEDPEGMFHRVSHNLAEADRLYDATDEQVKETEEKFHRAMRSLELLPNTPTLTNAGRELQQLSACFVLPVNDTLEDIFGAVTKTALIHKSGGGTGFAFSNLRPKGDSVGSTGGLASGPVSFIRAFDTGTDVVKQGGTRRGANMAILAVDHPDILEFIHAKQDGKNLQNFNCSVAVTDDFMTKVKTGEDYPLINPRTGSETGRVNARETFDTIVRMAWETGDPGLVFIDEINRGNPNPQLGRIQSTNPCGEQPLAPYESCNLASINLNRHVRYEGGRAEPDWPKITESVRTAVHMLDNVIDMNEYPLPEIDEMSKKTRRIGLGVMGLADLLILMGVRYDSQEAIAITRSVMRHVQTETHQASEDLAATRGCFPEWEGSIYGPGGSNRPMRNSAPTTVAPTGTISIIAGASSGIEPLFAVAFARTVMDNTRLVETNPIFEAVAKGHGFHSQEMLEEISSTGSLEKADVPQWVKDVFRCSHEIAPEWHVRMQAAAQEHTDNAVSKTINFPHSATEAEIAYAYGLAHELKCKGITVYRDGSKDTQVLTLGSTVNGKAQQVVVPRERPQTINGTTERVRTGHGNMYVTVNFDEDDIPFEVFGNLGKAGGCDSAQLEAITRLISMALRCGIDGAAVLEQMRGITCCPVWDNGTLIRSSPDAVAHALAKYVGAADHDHPPLALQPALIGAEQQKGRTVLQTGPKCPECNSPTIFLEGCNSCPTCNWNKCE